MAKKPDIRLGQLLVQKKLCSLRQVNEALLEQKNLRTWNANVPIGRILVERDFLDEESLREILAEMGVLYLQCTACQVDYPLDVYKRDSRHFCPQCRMELVLSDRPFNCDNPVRPLTGEAAESRGAARPAPSPVPTAAPPDATMPRPEPEGTGSPGDSFIGRVMGGCQLIEKIASGGMGVVYKAKQLSLGRIVAVKILSRDLANDAGFVDRFKREARAAGQLTHGNVVHIYESGECHGVVYFVMEYVDGQNLKEVLKSTAKLEFRRAVDITIQVCQALRHAHSRGVIHRDIKPENIMITHEGVVKLADLGLAKRMAAENTAGLTHAGAILGTPFYMAPEQAKDFSKVDRRSDIYSLGVTLYRMLTGKVPFDGRSPIEVMIKAIDGKKIPIRELREDVPLELEQIVDRMMQRNPDKRYQSVDEILQDLSRVTSATNVVPQT